MTPRLRFAVAVVAAASMLAVSPQTAQAAANNHKPAVPADIQLSGVACGGPIGTTTPTVTAAVADPDLVVVPGETVALTYALWPAGHPGQRTEWIGTPQSSPGTVSSAVPTPPAPLTNGAAYVLAVRATDTAGATSKWSPPCRFSVDTTVPHAPTVTSTDYPADTPSGGPGIAGRFTVAVSGGDTDVVKFRWSAPGVGLTDVPVDQTGQAIIEYSPTSFGTNVLTVQAIDRTLNRSAQTNYEFSVLNREPRVIDDNPGGGVGEPRTVTLRSAVPDVVEYTYWLNDEAPRTVPADADRQATITVTPDRPGSNILHVTARTASGIPCPQTDATLYVPVPTTPPLITSPDFPGDGTPPPLIGQEVTMTFTARVPGVTEFVWSTDLGQTWQVVAAGADGTATVHYTPPDWPLLVVTAHSRTSEGIDSSDAEVNWDLTSHAPVVESAQYPQNGVGSGPGEFTFRPAHDGVTGYEYSFGDDPVQTVAGETATITWTPETTGYVTLRVREHVGDIVSDATEYFFRVE